MKFILRLNLDNDAFQEPELEISRIVNKVSEKVLFGSYKGKCFDLNGNTVGEYAVLNDDEYDLEINLLELPF